MTTLRESVVAILGFSANELAELARIHTGHDDTAAGIDLEAQLQVFSLHHHFANPESLFERRSAEDIRQLCKWLESRAKTCGNPIAAGDLEHEGMRLTAFLLEAGIDPIEGEFRFRSR